MSPWWLLVFPFVNCILIILHYAVDVLHHKRITEEMTQYMNVCNSCQMSFSSAAQGLEQEILSLHQHIKEMVVSLNENTVLGAQFTPPPETKVGSSGNGV